MVDPHHHQEHSVVHPAFDPLHGGCDEWPLHYACRVGNLQHVQYLVQVANLSINQADRHDATPLYLAALTGNDEICQFLLQHGAKCDPEGDAARVFYVALSPALRTMLREWSLSAATQDPLLEMVRKALNDPTYSCCVAVDFISETNKKEYYIHKGLVKARCPLLLREHLVEDESQLLLPSFGSWWHVLEYIYTGVFETSSIDVATDVLCIANAYRLDVLASQLKSLLDRDYYNNPSLRFRAEVSRTDTLRDDLKKLVPMSIDSTANRLDNFYYSDVTLIYHDHTWKLHRLFLCSQSDYLDRAFDGNFREARDQSLDLSDMALESPKVVQLMVEWMYTGSFISSASNNEEAVQVLELGRFILCPRLSLYVANTVLDPTPETVFDLYYMSKLYGYDRLEDKCVQVMAESIEIFHEDGDDNAEDQLVALFAKELSETTQQGDVQITDVPVAAEIRSCIMKMAISDEEKQHRLTLMITIRDKALSK